MTDRELVARIAHSAGGKAGYKQLVRELGLGGGRERRLLLEQLARITARGGRGETADEQWRLPGGGPAGTAPVAEKQYLWTGLVGRRGLRESPAQGGPRLCSEA